VETPVAIEECLALGLEGVRGIVADSKAYSRRTLGLCLEHTIDLVTLVPRTCAVRQELEAWARQQLALPLLVEKPGRTKDEAPRRWHGQSVLRQVEVEYSDGRIGHEPLRFVVVHSSQLAQQQTQAYSAAQAKEAEAVVAHLTHVQARWFACEADAEAAIAEYEHRGPGRRGRLACVGDLFLWEASFHEEQERPKDLHLTGAEAGEVARVAGAHRLVLTHLVPWNDEARTQAEARSHFTGPIDLATSGAVFDLSATG
jgi:hypothetical protein